MKENIPLMTKTYFRFQWLKPNNKLATKQSCYWKKTNWNGMDAIYFFLMKAAITASLIILQPKILIQILQMKEVELKCLELYRTSFGSNAQYYNHQQNKWYPQKCLLAHFEDTLNFSSSEFTCT